MKYKLLPEHAAHFPEIRERCIANAMSTKHMDAAEREIVRREVEALYKLVNLPPPVNIVFVPSPFVLRFAGGFAAWIWHQRKLTRASTVVATDDATHAATVVATDAATDAATEEATFAATDAATYAATQAATSTATRAATTAATAAATDAATVAATYAAIVAATEDATAAETSAATYAPTSAATDAATTAATDAATAAKIRDAINDTTDAATYAATYAATEAATYAATDAETAAYSAAATVVATEAATEAATSAATADATRAATVDATYAATYAAIDDATSAATDAATADATRAATQDMVRDSNNWYFFNVNCKNIAKHFRQPLDILLQCAQKSYRMWSGGNQWSWWLGYHIFFRDVARLQLPIYDAYSHYEALAFHSGPRIMHEKFCMISDRPKTLTVDEKNRPHNEHGPFCEWRDGSALFAWHGVRTPAWIILSPEKITIAKIQAEKNSELKRIMIERYGLERYIHDACLKEIQSDSYGRLFRLPDTRFPVVLVKNAAPEPDGTFNTYVLTATRRDVKTAHEAVASTFGLTAEQYRPVHES